MTKAVVVGSHPRLAPPKALRRVEARPPEMRDAIRPMAEFRVLGPVEAVVAGRLVDLGAPKQRALLTLLVSRVGQPVPVELMLEALWAGYPPPSAMTSLQSYVANLRRALEPDRAPRTPATVLRTCSRGYLLDNRVVSVDVQRFGEHATAGWQAWDRGDPRQALTEFEAGLALWRGQAYAEVAGTTLVVPEVARLEELRLSVTEARCAALLAVGAHEVAVAELEAFTQAHPLREYGCELLSLALYRAGRQAEALGVLRTIQRRLSEELGIDPRPALQQLEREILNQVPALDWRPTPAAPTWKASSGPAATSTVATRDAAPSPIAEGEVFVGREAALRQLGAALAAASAGRGRVVTVSGEPGIGKTTLLRRFARLAGVPVLWGACPENVAAPPLWLWEEVLRGVGTCLPQHPAPGPVAELLDGDVEPAADGVDGAGATLRRFEAIVRYLTDASHTAPLVIVLDHLHRADPGSLRLLAHLAESVSASRLLLVVSYRLGETAILAETLAALARSGMTRIELSGLDVHDTQTLAGALLHREIGVPTAAGLLARTEGNPFFLRELIRVLTSERRLDHPHTAPVPVPVREVVLRRVARLPRAAVEVVSVAAVAGREFDIEVVAEAARVEIDAALEALDTAVAAGLIAEDQRRLGWFRFTHALTAEALYETTGRLRRARLHRRIGAAAARVWTGSKERAAEIARHWLLAAELDPAAAAHAAAHAATAARVADARLAFDDAVTLWRQALTAANLADLADPNRYPLSLGLGTSLCRAGRPHDGLPVFLAALEKILAAGEGPGEPDTSAPAVAAAAAISELTWYPVNYGEVSERLVGVFERVVARTVDPVRRALLLSCLAVARYHDSDPTRRVALSDEALALVRHTSDRMALAHVLRLRTVALDGPDHLDQRLRAVTELLRLPDLPALMMVQARQVRAQVLVTAGRVGEAAAELDSAARLAEEQCPPLRPQVACSRVGLLVLGGRWREADESRRAAYDPRAGADRGDVSFHHMIQRWEAAYLLGGSAGLVDDLRAVAEATGLPASHGILAMALIAAGRVHEARVALRRMPRVPRDRLWLYTCCWTLLAASRLGEVETIGRLRARLLAYRHLACSALDLAISGSVAYFTAEAALALGDRDAALADLAIAMETTERMGAQPWQSHVREAVRRAEATTEKCSRSRSGDSPFRYAQ